MTKDKFKADMGKAIRQAISKLDRGTVGIEADYLWQLTVTNPILRVNGPVGTNAAWVARQVFDEIVRDHPYANFVYSKEAQAASYEPKMLVCGAHRALVWRTPFGIESSYLGDDGHMGGTTLHGLSTWAEAVRSVCYGLAQLSADVESDDIPGIIAFDKHLVDDFRRWLGFQRAYRHAKANTATWQCDTDWHRWACEHGGEFVPRLEVA